MTEELIRAFREWLRLEILSSVNPNNPKLTFDNIHELADDKFEKLLKLWREQNDLHT